MKKDHSQGKNCWKLKYLEHVDIYENNALQIYLVYIARQLRVSTFQTQIKSRLLFQNYSFFYSVIAPSPSHFNLNRRYFKSSFFNVLPFILKTHHPTSKTVPPLQLFPSLQPLKQLQGPSNYFSTLLHTYSTHFLYNYQMSRKFETKNSKLSTQAIHKFQYYQTQIIPHLFASEDKFEDVPRCKPQKGITYFYGKSRRVGEYAFNSNTVLHSVKGTYLAKRSQGDQVMKINPFLYSKKNVQESSIWGSKITSELLEIVATDNSHPNKQNTVEQKTLTFHLVHHVNEDKLNDSSLIWLNFVEEITINETEITQALIATIGGEKKFIGWGCKVAQFQEFIKSYCMIDTLEGYLLQFGSTLKPEIPEVVDPAFNEQQNIVKAIPLKFLSIFHQLKKQFKDASTKDICRFMIAKEFKLEQSQKAIREYMQWKKEIQSKYKWEDFADIHDRGIFVVLGEDHMGRPVILNRSNRLNIYQVDLEKYCDYYVYFLEIYVPSLMRGNVYQMLIIGDAGDNKSQNFKLSLTKRNLLDSLKYCAERQHKLIAVNADSIAVYVYKLIRPMIPKRSQDKIIAVGSDKKQILKTLSEYLDPEIIPSYLGGQNASIF